MLQQRAQLAGDLEKIKPSDFADASLEEVAMGTGVELVYPADADAERLFRTLFENPSS